MKLQLLSLDAPLVVYQALGEVRESPCPARTHVIPIDLRLSSKSAERLVEAD